MGGSRENTKRRSVYKENVISNEKYLKEDNMEDKKMYHKAEGMYRFLFMLLCKFELKFLSRE